MTDLSVKLENKNQCSIINKFMHEKSCYKSSTSKYKKLNSNFNIYKISHLPFGMLCYLLEYDDTVQYLLKIGEYLETTRGSELSEWYQK